MFFTLGVSLADWFEQGIFDREKTVYEAHLKTGQFSRIYWLTYGGPEDRKLAARLQRDGRLHPAIEVLAVPTILNTKPGKLIHSLLAPLLYRRPLRACDYFKTNQMMGAWTAQLAHQIWRKPLLLRTGFTLTRFNTTAASPLTRKLYGAIERIGYSAFSHATVSSQHDRDYVLQRYGLDGDRVSVIPTYIDTDAFAPQAVPKQERKLVYVGRFVPQKNLAAAIEAVAETSFELDLYGSGELEGELRERAQRCGARVNFCGRIPNAKLPDVLNRYRFFILSSHFEGMPKALLEAMSCGLVCLGTSVCGIIEVLVDGVNGISIADTRVEAIRDCLQAIECSYDTDTLDRISRQARQTITDRFSLQAYIKHEYSLFKQNVISQS
ncbi:glycosyltransferase [Rubidibacter lacunae KORDI 51-2]|uniref:Glycosyltransferase n=2 Tax=Rubidibacter TaxID=582491 RepID=U5DLJ1_9CHRO|nr:glycosyltransferase [Rubidibacter lacunae KORDI 51-2]